MYKSGIFIDESKNRFLCTVLADGKITICYIPSSSRLDNYLDLKNKEVILIKNTSKVSSIAYSVFAMKHKQSYILLNTSIANRIIHDSIQKSRFSFLGKRRIIFREKKIGEYKTDIFINDTQTIIEIKSVISLLAEAEFPTVYSERSIEQLKYRSFSNKALKYATSSFH